MALAEVLVDTTTQEKLGNDGLEEVCGCLWAVDCQTCGKPLGAEPPALWIDDGGEYIEASLHHARCRSRSVENRRYRPAASLYLDIMLISTSSSCLSPHPASLGAQVG